MGHTHGNIIGWLLMVLVLATVFIALLLLAVHLAVERIETLEEAVLTPTPVAERAR